MYWAYSATDKVASMLAATACDNANGRGGQVPCSTRGSTLRVPDVSGSIHRPMRVHFRPQTIVRPQYLTMHPILVKCTSHPALHKVTMDRSECEARPGMMWAARASRGRAGMLRVQVCVECTCSSLGRHTMIGVIVCCTFEAGAVVVRKWLVAPESRMAQWLMVLALVVTV
jgi:hypothetical protein